MTLTTNINYLQPTGFKLVIDRKSYGNLEFFAQTVQHPSITLNAADLPYSRIAAVPFPGDKLTFGDLSATVIIDENMSAYTEMYNWMERLVETKYKPATSRTDDVPPSNVDITVSILSSHNNMVKRIQYIDCVPTFLGDINFEATVGDIQYLTFGVGFRFSYFTLV